MSTYKLYYFNQRGSAETIRLIFAQAAVKYEDVRVSQDDWPKMKLTTPSGTLPVLEIDGISTWGSGPIAKFLAERFGLAGSNDLENLQITGLYDVLSDLLSNVIVWFGEKDEERKTTLYEAVKNEHIPRYLGLLERKCVQNNNSDGWIYGNSPTYVDFAIYNYVEVSMMLFPGFLEQYPAIQKLQSSVGHLPNIAAWIKTRPATDH